MSIITDGIDDLDAPALTGESVELTWRQLDERIDRWGAALRDQISRGGRVGICAHNGVGMAALHLAALLASVPVVPMSPESTPREVARLAKLGDVRLLFVDARSAPAALAAAGDHPMLVVSLDGHDSAATTPVTEWAGDGAVPPLPGDLAPSPPLIFTSGTTGTPKATMLPPASFGGAETSAELQAFLRRGTFGGTAVHLVVGPLHHTGPLSGLRSAVSGSRVVIMDRFDAARALELIEQHRVEAMVAVPTHFVRMLQLPESLRARADVSSLRAVSHTGAACPVGVKQAMINWWGPILDEAYGASESGTVCRITSSEWLERPGSVGRTVEPFDPVVVDHAGDPLPAGQEGHLYFRDRTGRGITYLGDPAKTAAAHLAPGIFTLGEIGYVDDDGYVFVTDRAADMVVSGGVNIYPAEAEQVLAGHPAVADVACVGVPHHDLGERLIGLVVVGDDRIGDQALLEELHAHCRANLTRYKCPREIEVVASIPRSAMGKVDKKALAAQLVDGRARPLAPPPAQGVPT